MLVSINLVIGILFILFFSNISIFSESSSGIFFKFFFFIFFLLFPFFIISKFSVLESESDSFFFFDLFLFNFFLGEYSFDSDSLDESSLDSDSCDENLGFNFFFLSIFVKYFSKSESNSFFERSSELFPLSSILIKFYKYNKYILPFIILSLYFSNISP